MEPPMPRSPRSPGNPDNRRTRLALAAITGLLAGATRAIVGWLIEHLTAGS